LLDDPFEGRLQKSGPNGTTIYLFDGGIPCGHDLNARPHDSPPMIEEGEDRIRATYGKNYDRLEKSRRFTISFEEIRTSNQPEKTGHQSLTSRLRVEKTWSQPVIAALDWVRSRCVYKPTSIQFRNSESSLQESQDRELQAAAPANF
jgi:hypothetical protein